MRSFESWKDGDPPLPWGSFTLLRRVGRGAFGEVWEARQDVGLGLTRRCALKILDRAHPNDREKVEKEWGREFRALQNVDSPNVVRAWDSGEHDGRLWIVMEFVDGPDLLTWLGENGRVVGERFFQLASSLCDGLSAVHDLGLLHRDIKPQNILVGPGDVPRLTDFGLSVATASLSSASIDLGAGTVTYMSPEVAKADRADVRADIFSLGCVLFEMATGRSALPRGRAEVAQLASITIEQSEFGEPSRLDVLVVEADGAIPGLGALIRACLRRRPADRFDSVAALRQALVALFRLDVAALPAFWAGFHVQRLVHQGAAWEDFEAVRGDRPVLLRLLHPSVRANQAAIDRLRRLRPESGGLELLDARDHGGRCWLAFVELPGETALDRLRAGPIPAATVLDLAIRLVGACEEVEGAGLSPSLAGLDRVLLGDDGRVVLLDAGMSDVHPPAEPTGEPVFGALVRILLGLVLGAAALPPRGADLKPFVARMDDVVPGMAAVGARCLDGGHRRYADVAGDLRDLSERGDIDWDSPRYPRKWHHFTLLAKLGAGGFGAVWRAEYRNPTAPTGACPADVALKVLKRPDGLDRATWRREFLREAEIAISVPTNPHLAQAYRCGEDYGLSWLSMELVTGRTLQDAMRERNGPFPRDEIVRIGRGIALGLAALHGAVSPVGSPLGIVHRDLKPGNVMLGSRGAVKILDFGVAKVTTRDDGLSQRGFTKGTPAYLSPEQCRGEPLDGRSDLFALGVLLYELATGSKLFGARPGMDVPAILHEIVTIEERRAAAEAEVDAAAPGLCEIVGRCLRASPKDRPASGAEVASALDRWAGLGRSLGGREPLVPAMADAGPPIDVPMTERVPDLEPETPGTTRAVPARRAAPTGQADSDRHLFLGFGAGLFAIVLTLGSLTSFVVGEMAAAEARDLEWRRSLKEADEGWRQWKQRRREGLEADRRRIVALRDGEYGATIETILAGDGGPRDVRVVEGFLAKVSADVASFGQGDDAVQEPVPFRHAEQLRTWMDRNRARMGLGAPAPQSEWVPLIGLQMIGIPGGRFGRGTPGPGSRPESIPKGFLLGATEVTQGMWTKVMGTNPSESGTQRAGGEDRGACKSFGLGDALPVFCVDWRDAVGFANRLSELAGLAPAYVVSGAGVALNRDSVGYRLPTEVEWEWAARGGYSDDWGRPDPQRPVCAYANLASTGASTTDAVGPSSGPPPCEDGFTKAAPVGSFEVNGFDLKDMVGNVHEWTGHVYAPPPSPPGPGFANPSGTFRIEYALRGGSWWIDPLNAQVRARVPTDPGFRSGDVGFRLARSVP